jgi:hypothetical protein
MNMIRDTGVAPDKLFVQLFVVMLILLPSVFAMVRVLRSRSGTSLWLWMLGIWVFPILGPATAFLFVRDT